MNLRALAAALLSVCVLPLVAVVAPASAAEDAVLTWPEVTRFNYATTPYVIHAATSDPTGLVVRVNGGQPQPVGETGDLTPRFVRDGRQVVEVRRCAPTCVQVDYRILEAYTAFVVSKGAAQQFGPEQPLRSDYSAAPVGESAILDWSIVDPGATPEQDVVLASGTDPITTAANVPFGPVSLPAGTPDGRYELRRRLTGESADFGTLDAEFKPLAVTWDSTSEVGMLTLSERFIYPARDGYLDTVSIGVVTDLSPDVVVRDPSGNEHAHFDRRDIHGDRVNWNPGRALRPGRYSVSLTTTDRAGNVASVRKFVEVRNGKLAWKTFTKRIKAKATVVDKSVGSCSTLASPAAGGPQGSLGYYSQTKCTREADSGVSTVSYAYLPTSFLGDYLDFRVSVSGGKARGVRDAYAVLYYYDARHKKYVNRAQLSPASGVHAGKGVRLPGDLVRDVNEKPHVFWYLGLTSGSRYDVTSFTVSVRYQKLV